MTSVQVGKKLQSLAQDLLRLVPMVQKADQMLAEAEQHKQEQKAKLQDSHVQRVELVEMVHQGMETQLEQEKHIKALELENQELKRQLDHSVRLCSIYSAFAVMSLEKISQPLHISPEAVFPLVTAALVHHVGIPVGAPSQNAHSDVVRFQKLVCDSFTRPLSPFPPTLSPFMLPFPPVSPTSASSSSNTLSASASASSI